MFCVKCGNQYSESATFCTSCGNKRQGSQISKEVTKDNKKDNVKVVKINKDAANGQDKCPKCGATEISFSTKKGKLRCHFCRHEFDQVQFEKHETDISKLEGVVIGSGAQDIIADTNDILTFLCTSCAAEVIVNTSEKLQARCHWCRNTLSVNEQIANGAVPDMILPFSVEKSAAQRQIKEFVKKRSFFAHPSFKREFCTENITGVYLPYMVVDINAQARYKGQGEVLVKQRGSGKDATYDADLYNVNREFDIVVKGLTVEASKEKLQHDSAEKTNNIINAIMPFDTENESVFNANYIKGYSSEKRTANIEKLNNHVHVQAKDVSRFSANDTIEKYSRGVRWDHEELNVKGKQWKAAYLPIWLYSYQSVNNNKKLLHYVAVNARTEKTMGSVPINMPKLLSISSIVQFIGSLIAFHFFWILFIIDAMDDSGDAVGFLLLFFLAGVAYYGYYYRKYRNLCARHEHELDTQNKISNVTGNDQFVKHIKRLDEPHMKGHNNYNVSNDRQGFFGEKNSSKGIKGNALNMITSLNDGPSNGERKKFQHGALIVCMILSTLAALIVNIIINAG